ncbi:MAG: hypothetical protein FJ164_10100 [Gammaproteobacteria bacterium]|nr:hypothetical protein [Gammaproteobacteria bacterium]
MAQTCTMEYRAFSLLCAPFQALLRQRSRRHRAPDIRVAELKLRIASPARLHLGFLDLNGSLGRRFGSVGLAITGLDARVTAALCPPGEAPAVSAANHGSRIEAVLTALSRHYGEQARVQISLEASAPVHAGLGSGTQLALAVAKAWTLVHGLEVPTRTLAGVVGRGQRSGIGIAVFEQGGVVIDGGRVAGGAQPAPVLARYEFPAAWRIVLVFDEEDHGLHGPEELAAFARLPPMSESVAAALARWCLLGLMPALAEGDFPAFSAAIDEIQTRVGDYFAPCQGGRRHASPAVAAALESVRARFGLRGLGQTSWGPTGFVFVPDTETADAVVAHLETTGGSTARLRCQVVTGCNHGAIIESKA